MKKLESFVENNDVLFSKNLIEENRIKEIETITSTKIGDKLRAYIVKYGFLCFKHIELYGINSKQGINSDMVNMTLRLHEQYPSTKSMIVLEDRGDGDFILVDENDSIYEFDSYIDTIARPLNKDIFDYILDRFNDI